MTESRRSLECLGRTNLDSWVNVLNYMQRLWITLVSLALVAFAGLVVTWNIVYRTQQVPFIIQSYYSGERLAKITSIIEREEQSTPAAATERRLDLTLPADARLFMMDMTGPTNYCKIGYYFYLTYYLFPREIGISIDEPAYLNKDGFTGRTATSDKEIIDHGYNVRIDITPEATQITRVLPGYATLNANNPAWFSSYTDTILSFLLPGFTTLAGMWLFRLVFPSLALRMLILEQLAYGLGLGMMAVAALTLGIKLSGFHGYRVVFVLTAAAGLMEIWHSRKIYWLEIADGCRKLVRRPIAIALLMAGIISFLILFRLAGLEGLNDPDAMRWMLKAKMIHLCTGSDLVRWFSNPLLAHAHLDYPTLVPSLHATTYDSLGHVDEFVTKFWPAWMLLLLLGALDLQPRPARPVLRPLLRSFGVVIVAFHLVVRPDGGGRFFHGILYGAGFRTVRPLAGRKRPRPACPGVDTFIRGSHDQTRRVHLSGHGGGLDGLLPSARPPLKPLLPLWRAMAFCFLAAIPFFWLRVQIPELEYESGWVGYALQNPANALIHWPGIFFIMLARFFVCTRFCRLERARRTISLGWQMGRPVVSIQSNRPRSGMVVPVYDSDTLVCHSGPASSRRLDIGDGDRRPGDLQPGVRQFCQCHQPCPCDRVHGRRRCRKISFAGSGGLVRYDPNHVLRGTSKRDACSGSVPCHLRIRG